jgi:two-component system, response regulator
MRPASRRAPTILVIEDNDDHREILQRQLEALGAQVLVATDGVDGLALLERWQPDAVLCDLTMPTMGGLEFAMRVRCDPRHRAVLLMAVTGRSSQSDLLETWRVGFDGHLLKPVTSEMLNSVVHRLARQSASRQEPCA